MKHKKRGIHPNSKAWRTVRAAVLDRDNNACVQCGAGGRLEVDHKVPIAAGGAVLDEGNLQTLCRPCHFAKTGDEARARKSKRTDVKELEEFWRSMM